MPIQILGLRDYVSKQGKKGKAARFFNKNWHLSKIEDVFSQVKVKKLLETIPESDHWNLYFTVADCIKERELESQIAIPFDVDWVEYSETSTKELVALQTRKILAEIISLKVPEIREENIACLWSGHGVQLFVLLEESFIDKKVFDEYSVSYKRLCKLFSSKLKENGVVFRDVDTTVFSHARLMRLPYTINRKEGHEDTESFLVGDFSPAYLPMFLEKEILRKDHVLNDTVLKSYPKPDTKGVLAGCDFLKWCRSNQNQVTEPQWYAMLSIVARLESGNTLCHEYSKEYAGYDEHATDTKIEQALSSAGPRTCEGVDAVWGKCSGCSHYQSNDIKSPVLIKSDDYIATEGQGFRRLVLGKDGSQKPGKLEYGDLLKAFIRDFRYKSQVVSEGMNGAILWKYEDDHWSRLYRGDIAAWAEKKTNGAVSSSEVLEFVGKVTRCQMLDADFFENSVINYKQFKNCVLDMRTGEVLPPAPELGVVNVIPHVYNKDAVCPQWDKFLDDVCVQDVDKVRILNEFLGYILFSDRNWIAKALMLLGSGGNGKSVYIDVVKAIVGDENCTSIRMEQLSHEYSVASLDNKLLNACGEVSYKALRDTSGFKDMVSGGKLMGRATYEPMRPCNIRAKFILSCNEIPTVYDQSIGFGRRPLVVNFNARFDNAEGCDPHLTEKLIAETPGIINKALKSYRDLYERKGFYESEATLREKEEFLRGSNEIAEFVAAYFERGSEDEFVKSSVILDMAKQYCANENIDERKFHSKKIAQEIYKRFLRKSKPKKINGKVFKCYSGLYIKEDIDLDINEEY